MHGIPERLINHATRDQLLVLWEIVQRDEADMADGNQTATANGIVKAFTGKK